MAPDSLVFLRDGERIGSSKSHVDAVGAAADVADVFSDVTVLEDARKALVHLGYKAVIARRAVDLASVRVNRDTDLVGLLEEALRNCG